MLLTLRYVSHTGFIPNGILYTHFVCSLTGYKLMANFPPSFSLSWF